MNKYIIVALGIGIILIVFSTISTTKNSDQANTSVGISKANLVVLEQPYDFGDIEIFAGKVSTNYTLKNESTESITITKAATSCMCTEGEIAGLTFGLHGSEVKSVVIPAGGEEIVKATFDPLAHGPNGVGPVTRTLTLETNSTETPKIEMRFSANVIKTEG